MKPIVRRDQALQLQPAIDKDLMAFADLCMSTMNLQKPGNQIEEETEPARQHLQIVLCKNIKLATNDAYCKKILARKYWLERKLLCHRVDCGASADGQPEERQFYAAPLDARRPETHSPCGATWTALVPTYGLTPFPLI
jgi:hypothetical protein